MLTTDELKRKLVYLKVKIKNLADEARTIKQEEAKAKVRKHTDLLNGLVLHRKSIVRDEARCSLIAYAFLRNKPKPHSVAQADIRRITQILGKFGVDPVFKTAYEDQMKRFGEWK